MIWVGNQGKDDKYFCQQGHNIILNSHSIKCPDSVIVTFLILISFGVLTSQDRNQNFTPYNRQSKHFFVATFELIFCNFLQALYPMGGYILNCFSILHSHVQTYM